MSLLNNKLYAEICELTDSFCNYYLTPNYAYHCCKIAKYIYTDANKDLLVAKTVNIAGGIIYNLASINKLFLQNSTFHITAHGIAEWFGISKHCLVYHAHKIKKIISLDAHLQNHSQLAAGSQYFNLNL